MLLLCLISKVRVREYFGHILGVMDQFVIVSQEFSLGLSLEDAYVQQITF